MNIQKQVLNSVHDAAIFKRRVRVLSRHLTGELREGGTVLDVGCGDGSIALALAGANPLLKFEGIDVLRRPNAAIPVTIYDGESIPFADGSFDWVTIVDVLHHTDDPGAVLAECVRVARRGVVVKDHLREGFGAGRTLRLMDWVGNRGHDVRLPYNYLSREEWRSTFEAVGVEAVTWKEELGLYPTPLSLAFDRNLHFVSTVRPKTH